MINHFSVNPETGEVCGEFCFERKTGYKKGSLTATIKLDNVLPEQVSNIQNITKNIGDEIVNTIIHVLLQPDKYKIKEVDYD